MKGENLKTEIIVKEQKINVLTINNEEYISLTDLARYADDDEPRLPIRDWMRNKEVIAYLGLWENINNKNFKGGEFATFKNEAGSNKFKMSPQKWIKGTNAIGMISKSGRYDGGTFAHSDIAFEFASWLSPEFKLYLITEFQRLKKKEAYQDKIEWNANRILAKINYKIHTDAIKNNLIPTKLTKEQINYIYAEEADVLNMALFGQTAKEWRKQNLELKGNIREYASINELICLANLENLNSVFINDGLSQSVRLERLNKIAISQMKILNNSDLVLLEKNKEVVQ